ncbi:MAG: FlgT C-terminal domain-containing protein, partial [Oleibacter sp.]|nr:FlgT C-terminal domain-containing protein [Thalassolituus sp.]
TRLLQQASRDVNKSLACAPFMAKIRQASGRRLVIDAGTASGIRPGDQLSVYRTSTQFDARQQITTQLHRTPIQAMVKQVQPDMVIADTGVLNSHFSIQQDDVIIVW